MILPTHQEGSVTGGNLAQATRQGGWEIQAVGLQTFVLYRKSQKLRECISETCPSFLQMT